MKTAILIGAGERGLNTYGAYALKYKDKLKFVAVAEPDDYRRNYFKENHNIEDKYCVRDWKDLLKFPKIADIAIIATLENLHKEPALAFLDLGYNILIEKPVAPTIEDSVQIIKKAIEKDKYIMPAYVLRFSDFYKKIREIIDLHLLGEIVSVIQEEHIGYWHMAHSYVRGRWRKSKDVGPIILTKSCHDLDILQWILGKKCLQIYSTGSLKHFRKENCPNQASDNCLDCKLKNSCPYSATKIYLNMENNGWPVNTITNDLSYEGRINALRTTNFGKCVYKLDNDVLDNQKVLMKFDDSIDVIFTLDAFTHDKTRIIKITGSKGDLFGNFAKNYIEINTFSNDKKEVIELNPKYKSSHQGSDFNLLDEFLETLDSKKPIDYYNFIESHFMAFASEYSRINNTIVDYQRYKEEKIR